MSEIAPNVTDTELDAGFWGRAAARLSIEREKMQSERDAALSRALAAESAVGAMKAALEEYARRVNWTTSVTIYHDNPDGSEVNYDAEVDTEIVWNGYSDFGYTLAQEALASLTDAVGEREVGKVEAAQDLIAYTKLHDALLEANRRAQIYEAHVGVLCDVLEVARECNEWHMAQRDWHVTDRKLRDALEGIPVGAGAKAVEAMKLAEAALEHAMAWGIELGTSDPQWVVEARSSLASLAALRERGT